MQLTFLELMPDERRLYLEQAAFRRNLSPVIMEKDFWVCWLLGTLFQSEFADSLVFKGGTSLSKVFGIIERFSEDIDLSVSPRFLNLPEAGTSRNQANKWMNRAETVCGEAVNQQIRPALEIKIASILEFRPQPWLEYISDPVTRSPVLLFHYPFFHASGFEYLPRTVKIEFGALTDQQPTGRHPIRPWIADIFPQAFSDWECEVTALELERTFWEKATILHTEYHRPTAKPTPVRFSRHYADTASLAAHPAGLAAVERIDICDRVVHWKSRFFGSSWANYATAKPGSFRLVPPPDRQSDLKRDYGAMRAMYLADPPSFDDILTVLADLEDKINRQSTG